MTLEKQIAFIENMILDDTTVGEPQCETFYFNMRVHGRNRESVIEWINYWYGYKSIETFIEDYKDGDIQ